MFKDIISQLHVALNQHKHIFAMCYLTARMTEILSSVGNFCWGVKVPVIAQYTSRWRQMQSWYLHCALISLMKTLSGSKCTS